MLGERRLVGRHEPVEGQGPSRGRHVGGVDVVLERDRDAVQRAAHLALRALAIESFRFPQRVAIHRDRRVQLVLVERDALEVLADQFPRSDAPLFHGGPHLWDGRLDDARPAAPVGRARQPGAQGHKKEHPEQLHWLHGLHGDRCPD